MWPGEAGAQVLNAKQPGYDRHLAADAEFAEELADRYMITHARPGVAGMPTARAARKFCLDQMFSAVATTHGVTPEEVARHLGSNRLPIDVALNLPFFLLYAFASSVIAGKIWKRCPPRDGWLAGLTLIVFGALIFGVIGLLVGEQWSTTMESFRIGAGHLGIRVSRLPWARYPGALFAFLVVLFCVVAAFRARSSGTNSPAAANRPVLDLATRAADS